MSQALLEGNHMDPRSGRWAATNLAEYLVPVNADAPDVTVDFVEVHDELVGPLGAKGGVGEIGQVASPPPSPTLSSTPSAAESASCR